jgi:hypothetical protein
MGSLLFVSLLACGGPPGDGGGPGVDAGTDSGPEPAPTIAEICAARDGCVDPGDPRAGACADVLGGLEGSSSPECDPCLRCLGAATCDEWTQSPNGPLPCDEPCRACEGDVDGEFWDECVGDSDCAYGHFCVEAVGRCQRVCEEGAQCNLTFCGEDHLCWLACGDTRCPEGAACTDQVIGVDGNSYSVCAGGE